MQLGLSKWEVDTLYKKFCLIDKDRSGSISTNELLTFLKLDDCRFSKRIFSIFDESCNNSIEFQEFVVTLWNYCTLSKSSLVLFTFDLYDRSSSGSLKNEDLIGILQVRPADY